MTERTPELTRSALDERDADGGLALIVVHSPDAELAGARVPLDRSILVGRHGNPEADLRIADPRLSRRHATIVPRADGAGVELLEHGSRNGTFVDGVRRAGGRVPHGSVVRMGNTLFVIGRLPGAPPAAQPAAIVGHSARLGAAVRACEEVAASDLPVLLVGETGTGKELFARLVHDRSERRGAFVTINCAAIPKDLLESYLFGHKKGAFTGAIADTAGYLDKAEGGTLFFDEIGELRLDLQSKLLRVLENREFSLVGSAELQTANVRVVAATNVELARDAETGTFRRDLYARISAAIVRLPPLRQRREDIPLLARHFIAAAAPGRAIAWTPSFLERLVSHDWPMNVRELRSTIQRLLLHIKDGSELKTSHLAGVLDGGREDAAALAEPDRDASDAPARDELVALLREHRGNVSEIAKHYGKGRRQIYRWLKKHDLESEDFR